MKLKKKLNHTSFIFLYHWSLRKGKILIFSINCLYRMINDYEQKYMFKIYKRIKKKYKWKIITQLPNNWYTSQVIIHVYMNTMQLKLLQYHSSLFYYSSLIQDKLDILRVCNNRLRPYPSPPLKGCVLI